MNEITYVSVYKNENYKFDQPFLSFPAKIFIIGKSRVCQMTKFSVALNKSKFDGNIILLECEDSKQIRLFFMTRDF